MLWLVLVPVPCRALSAPRARRRARRARCNSRCPPHAPRAPRARCPPCPPCALVVLLVLLLPVLLLLVLLVLLVVLTSKIRAHLLIDVISSLCKQSAQFADWSRVVNGFQNRPKNAAPSPPRAPRAEGRTRGACPHPQRRWHTARAEIHGASYPVAPLE